MGSRLVHVPPLPAVDRPQQAELFPVVGAQLDLWGVWWRPAGRRWVSRAAWSGSSSAGVVTPAERSHGITFERSSA